MNCPHCKKQLESKKKYLISEKGRLAKKKQNKRYYLKKKAKIKNLTNKYNAILDKKSGEEIPTIQQDQENISEDPL